MNEERILVIGANGQIGTALLPELKNIYGASAVIASDIRNSAEEEPGFEILDATNRDALFRLVEAKKITQIYHLAAVLSARAEADPIWAWNLNMQTLLNVLEAGRIFKLNKLFIPSSIAVFGDSAPQEHTPQAVFLDPSSVYGISKVATENWCNYYYLRYGLDVRSLRYPGVISYQSMPGGGTTDYAVDMYHKAVAGEHYQCYLSAETRLPMIYMDDAIRATIELMEAPEQNLTVHTSYNLSGMDFTPLELMESIRGYYPDFNCTFEPDFRQHIADSWPASIDDSSARREWNWQPKFDLKAMSAEMIHHLSEVYQSKAAE